MKAAQTPLETARTILPHGQDPEKVAQADAQEGEGEGTQQVSDPPTTTATPSALQKGEMPVLPPFLPTPKAAKSSSNGLA